MNKLVKALAKAICLQAFGYDVPGSSDYDIARVAIKAVENTGWTLMPNEPTEEMLAAGCRPFMDKKGGIEIYRAMLAARPDPLEAIPASSDG